VRPAGRCRGGVNLVGAPARRRSTYRQEEDDSRVRRAAGLAAGKESGGGAVVEAGGDCDVLGRREMCMHLDRMGSTHKW
jgi:hypothetical protein